MTKPTTMRRLPRQARGEQRIAAILQAAAQVFYEVGFDAATTDMVAQRAHASGSGRGADQENSLGLRQALPAVGRGCGPAFESDLYQNSPRAASPGRRWTSY